jgi:hypothetical protein
VDVGQHCDISELLGDGPCAICTTTRPAEIRLDGWDELRALASIPEPEPLVLHIPA